MTLRLFVSLIASLTVAGCGDGGGQEGGSESGGETASETGEPATDIAFADFYVEAEAAWCTWQVACRQYGVEERCAAVNHMEERLSMRRLSGVGSDESVPFAYMAQAIEVGRIGYDSEAAALCLEYVRAHTCDRDGYHIDSEAELAGKAACEAVFRGRMGANGPCMTANECADVAVCGFDPTCVDACCVGACRVLPRPIAVGEPCNFNQACVADAYCAQDPDTFLPTVCTAAPKLGQACPQGPCAGAARCDFNSDKPVCVALTPPGGRCSYQEECEQPAYCSYESGDYGECKRPIAEGQACDASVGDQCLRVDNYCSDVDDACVVLPGKGEACTSYACRGDFFCSEAYGQKCIPVADEGEGCGYSSVTYESIPCSGDHFCDYSLEQPMCVKAGSGSTCPVPKDPLAGA